MNDKQVHEIALLRFISGVDAVDQRAGMETLGDFIRAQPGHVSRSMYRDEANGWWIDHVAWEDAEAAERAMRRSQDAPELAGVFALIDLDFLRISHYQRVS